MSMPKTNSTNKPVRSFRLSHEGTRQLRSMATTMGRSESDVIEVALDRMYREEIRFNRLLREGDRVEDQYQVNPKNKERNESNSDAA
jgi:predicted transcriptional regulator